jgi:hypothetical protein
MIPYLYCVVCGAQRSASAAAWHEMSAAWHESLRTLYATVHQHQHVKQLGYLLYNKP